MSIILHTTSSTRPAHAAGRIAFETDTGNLIISDGTYWRSFANDGASGWSGTNAYSMNFDGTDDRLNVASPVTTSAQQGSISAWIKTTSTSNTIVFTQTDVSDTFSNTYLFFSILGTGEPRLGWRSGNNTSDLLIKKGSSTNLNNGNWHHVAWTSDGSTWKIYVDGTDEGTLTTVSGSASDGNWFGGLSAIDTCRIGCQDRDLGTDSFFNGNIDEVAVFDSALSASQIDNIYKGESNGGNGGTIGTPGNLLSFSPNHWWRMGDGLEAGSGSIVYDMSNSSVNATKVNATSGSNASGAKFDPDTP